MSDRSAVLKRFLIGIGLGLLVAIPLSEAAFYIQRGTTSRPPQTVELVIPAGTAVQVAQGNSILPADMVFVQGDTLQVTNQDSVTHTLGPLVIPPGSTASMKLDQLGNLSYVCSFQPTKYLGLDVTAALTIWVRLEGIFIAGIPLGILGSLYSLILKPLHKKDSPLHPS